MSANALLCSTCNQWTVRFSWEKVNLSDLTGYRLWIFKNAVEKCLETAGYQLTENTGIKQIYICTKIDQDLQKPVTVICGPILNVRTGRKETEITTEQYRMIRSKDLQKIWETRNAENPETENSLEILTDASLKFTLLQSKINQAIALNLTEDFVRNRETGSKGATFVLYNVSRIAAIRKKYFDGVANKIYPPIPPVDHIDFSVLTEPEEWALLFNFLLEYPSLIRRCAEDLISGKPAIHHICKFLFDLCSLFSAYYRRDRILLEPKAHLLPLVHARLWLTMSIEQILENGLLLLDIKTLEEM